MVGGQGAQRMACHQRRGAGVQYVKVIGGASQAAHDNEHASACIVPLRDPACLQWQNLDAPAARFFQFSPALNSLPAHIQIWVARRAAKRGLNARAMRAARSVGL